MKTARYLTLLILATALSLSAQQQSVSPYSLFGSGWYAAQANAYQQLLGGASAADRNPWYINPDQPAALSALKYTTLDLGGQWAGIRQSDSDEQLWNQTGGFNHFGIAVPLIKGMAIAGSLRPYTAVGYDLQTGGTDSSFGDWYRRYTGRGGLNATAISWSWAPIKYVSVGVTSRYLFGTAERNNKLYFTNATYDYVGEVEQVSVSDWRWQMGGQAIIPIGTHELTAGYQYEPSAALDAIQDYHLYSFNTNATGSELVLDTVRARTALPGSVVLGSRSAAGLRWASTRKNAMLPAWTVAVHAEQLRVDQQRDFGATTSGTYAKPATSLVVNATVVPMLAFSNKRLTSYWSQIQYIGAYRADRFGLTLNGLEVTGWNANLGMAMPVGGRSFIPGDVKVSTVHLGLSVGQVGRLGSGLVREQYLRAFVGVTLNDQWFMKAKFR
jgi:hypothetical protein